MGNLEDQDVKPLGEHLYGKRIALLVSGSISAYKTPSLVRHFRQYGADVHVYLTEGGERYVTRNSLEWCSTNEVISELTSDAEHLKDFDAYVVAPATYDVIGKFANGIADDAVSTTLASALGRLEKGDAKILLAPAMHGTMQNSIYRENLEKLKSRGVKILEPDYRMGKANLPGSHDIVVHTIRELSEDPLKGKNVLINAGPTMGKIDNVRAITNIFRGILGIDIADELFLRGANVKLIYGAGGLEIPKYVDTTRVKYFEEMYEEVMKEIEKPYEIGIFSAAISDYIPEETFNGKIPSKGALKEIKLKQTPKIIKEVREKRPDMFMITFKLENNISIDELLKIGRKRLEESDIVVVNRLEDMTQDSHVSYIMENDGTVTKARTKKETSKKLVDAIGEYF